MPAQVPNIRGGSARIARAAGVVEETALAWTDLQDWLGVRGLMLKSVPATSDLDPVAHRGALFLGQRRSTLESFYEAVKRRASGGYQRRFWVAELPGAAVSDICQFSTMLLRSGFLAEFRYVKPSQIILFRPLEDGRVTAFLTGGWMERYVLQLVRVAVKRMTGMWNDAQALRGAQLILPNGRDMELDLLVGLFRGAVLWFECKTRTWQNCPVGWMPP